MKLNTRKLAFSGMIAALYWALTVWLSVFSYGPIQFRVSEALTILPFFSPYFIPGLFAGCFLSNIFSPVGIVDIIFGSSATLIAAILTYLIGRTNIKFKKYLAPMPPVLVNALIIGWEINKVYGAPFIIAFIEVGFGELVVCYLIGLPLLLFIEKNKILKKYIC
ncbi:MAG TPA: QueT transporter family protein [Clostridiaceae bacterium]